METHRNRDRLNALIQKLWSPRKHEAIPKHKSPEHLFQSPEKPVGVWPLNSTGFGAHTCREGAFTCTASCRKLWTNSSIFWSCHPSADCCLGAVRGAGERCQAWIPCLGNYSIRQCTTLIQLCTSRPIFPLFHLGPGAADGQYSASNIRKSLCAGWTAAPECNHTEEAGRPIRLYRWAPLLVIFLAIFSNLVAYLHK